jgi:hypothetical protein
MLKQYYPLESGFRVITLPRAPVSEPAFADPPEYVKNYDTVKKQSKGIFDKCYYTLPRHAFAMRACLGYTAKKKGHGHRLEIMYFA